MTSFRDQIKTYVDDHWMVPCKDGIVWVYYAGIGANQRGQDSLKCEYRKQRVLTP